MFLKKRFFWNNVFYNQTQNKLEKIKPPYFSFIKISVTLHKINLKKTFFAFKDARFWWCDRSQLIGTLVSFYYEYHMVINRGIFFKSSSTNRVDYNASVFFFTVRFFFLAGPGGHVLPPLCQACVRSVHLILGRNIAEVYRRSVKRRGAVPRARVRHLVPIYRPRARAHACDKSSAAAATSATRLRHTCRVSPGWTRPAYRGRPRKGGGRGAKKIGDASENIPRTSAHPPSSSPPPRVARVSGHGFRDTAARRAGGGSLSECAALHTDTQRHIITCTKVSFVYI